MSQDWPFSVTSKFTVDTGAEHLVTIRAATAADMRARLVEASGIFPYASLITALEQETAQVQPALVSAAAAQTVTPLKSNGNGNGNGHGAPVPPRSPVAAAVAGQTQRAHLRAAQGRVSRQANQPACPDHGLGIPSKKVPGGLYCPTEIEDGSWCKWHWAPAPAGTGSGDADYTHPRDEN